VIAGALLGEIINVEDVFATRTAIRSRTSGLVFGMRTQRLAVPGDVVIKVAGKEALAWRTGNLLTN
jgi:predicted deacylase